MSQTSAMQRYDGVSRSYADSSAGVVIFIRAAKGLISRLSKGCVHCRRPSGLFVLCTEGEFTESKLWRLIVSKCNQAEECSYHPAFLFTSSIADTALRKLWRRMVRNRPSLDELSPAVNPRMHATV